jgi:hypothetical protein
MPSPLGIRITPNILVICPDFSYSYMKGFLYSLATFPHYKRSKFARKTYIINLFNHFKILLSHPIPFHRAVPVVLFFINHRCPRFRPVIQPLPLVCSCRKFYLASRPGLSIRCSFMLPCYLSTVLFLRPSMASSLAAPQHDLIRDMILDESLTIYFASGWRVKRTEASRIFLVELSGICWNHQVVAFQQR